MKLIASSRFMVPSIPHISLRWVIISRTSLSENSKILVIMLASESWITPCSWPSETMDLISSSVTSVSSSKSLMPNRYMIPCTVSSISLVKGLRPAISTLIKGLRILAHPLGCLLASFLGRSTPIDKNTYKRRNAVTSCPKIWARVSSNTENALPTIIPKRST